MHCMWIMRNGNGLGAYAAATATTTECQSFPGTPLTQILSLFICYILHHCLFIILPLPSSPQTLVPVAGWGWHSQQAQQEPLWLPWRLQVLWRYQHGPGLLQARRADTFLLVCVLLFQHWVRHVLWPVFATARGVDYYQRNTQSGWYGFAAI